MRIAKSIQDLDLPHCELRTISAPEYGRLRSTRGKDAEFWQTVGQPDEVFRNINLFFRALKLYGMGK